MSLFKTKTFPKYRHACSAFLRIQEPSPLEVSLIRYIIVNGKLKFVFFDYEDGVATKFFSNNKYLKTILFMYGPQCHGYGDDDTEPKNMLETSFVMHIDKITLRSVEDVNKVTITGRIAYE